MTRAGIFLPPGEGRSYAMGRIGAVFKADGDETRGGYSISEWWLEPHTQGPGAHAHAEDNSSRAGVLNFSIPGDFEKNMPAIVEWFAANPPADT